MHRLTCIGVALTGALVVVSAALPAAQRRGRGNNAGEGAPVATNMIGEDPAAYYGKLVTVSAGVDRMLSTTTFLVDQRHVSQGAVVPLGHALLVVAPYLHAPLAGNHYVLVHGRVVKFDAAGIARAADGYALDLPPDVAAGYAGQPVLVATSVLDSTSVELAAKPIPPPTANEQAVDAAMKIIAPAFAALRAAAQHNEGPAVASHAATLADPFATTEQVWDGVGQSAAAQWARDARAQASAIQRAATAGDWDAVKASYGSLTQLCQTCHATYRAQQDDGTYRFRAGSF